MSGKKQEISKRSRLAGAPLAAARPSSPKSCPPVDTPEVLPGGRGFPPRAIYLGLKLVAFDVDGVLTDGRIILDSAGIESKFFNARDGLGIGLLQQAGLKVALLTARSSPVVAARARDMKIPPERVKQGAQAKLPAFQELLAENKISATEAAFVGDDLLDLPVLALAGLACCPGDAHPAVRKACHAQAGRGGGLGGARQICEHILQQRGAGTWEKLLGQYASKI